MPVVYEGVEPQEGNGTGGDLFSGMSFWLAQRLPSRQWFLDMVRVCTLRDASEVAHLLIVDRLMAARL